MEGPPDWLNGGDLYLIWELGPGAAGGGGPVAFRFRGESTNTNSNISYAEAHRLGWVLDEPEGVGGWLEPACEVGGCQWWK